MKGSLREVVERADVARLELHGRPAVAVEGHVVVGPAQGHLQPLELQLAQLVPAHGLVLGVPDLVHRSPSVSAAARRLSPRPK